MEKQLHWIRKALKKWWGEGAFAGSGRSSVGWGMRHLVWLTLTFTALARWGLPNLEGLPNGEMLFNYSWEMEKGIKAAYAMLGVFSVVAFGTSVKMFLRSVQRLSSNRRVLFPTVYKGLDTWFTLWTCVPLAVLWLCVTRWWFDPRYEIKTFTTPSAPMLSVSHEAERMILETFLWIVGVCAIGLVVVGVWWLIKRSIRKPLEAEIRELQRHRDECVALSGSRRRELEAWKAWAAKVEAASGLVADAIVVLRESKNGNRAELAEALRRARCILEAPGLRDVLVTDADKRDAQLERARKALEEQDGAQPAA